MKSIPLENEKNLKFNLNNNGIAVRIISFVTNSEHPKIVRQQVTIRRNSCFSTFIGIKKDYKILVLWTR